LANATALMAAAAAALTSRLARSGAESLANDSVNGFFVFAVADGFFVGVGFEGLLFADLTFFVLFFLDTNPPVHLERSPP
jgi:hypothetical protein